MWTSLICQYCISVRLLLSTLQFILFNYFISNYLSTFSLHIALSARLLVGGNLNNAVYQLERVRSAPDGNFRVTLRKCLHSPFPILVDDEYDERITDEEGCYQQRWDHDIWNKKQITTNAKQNSLNLPCSKVQLQLLLQKLSPALDRDQFPIPTYCAIFVIWQFLNSVKRLNRTNFMSVK